MRTTLQLDDDVLEAARVLARQRQSTIGTVISDLARQTLSRPVERGSGRGAEVVLEFSICAIRWRGPS